MIAESAQLKLQRLAWALGVAGLIPFVAHVVALWWFPVQPAPILIASSQTLYAALIMTFLGGLHWGIALTDPTRFAKRITPMMLWSVVPSIYAWMAAQLTQHRALMLLAIGLVVAFLVDWLFYRRYADLRWFIRLRLVLTVVAVSCLLVTWWVIR